MDINQAIRTLQKRLCAQVEPKRAKLRTEAPSVSASALERESNTTQARIALANTPYASMICVHGKVRKLQCTKCG